MKRLAASGQGGITHVATNENDIVETTTHQFHCAICNINCMNEFSLLQHLAGEKHKKKVQGAAPVLQCKVCDVTCSSEFSLLQHLSGAPHKKRIAEGSGNTNSTNAAAAIPGQPQQQPQEQQWYCEACRVGCPTEESYKQHISGKRHKKKVAKLNGALRTEQSLPSPALSSGNGVIQSSNEVVTPLPVVPLQPTFKLESKEDSDEEGQVDEEDEDVRKLYDDFSNQNGSTRVKPRSILKKEDGAIVESDEADMFGDSDDDGEAQNKSSVPDASNVTTLESGLSFSLDYSPEKQSSEMSNAKGAGVSWADNNVKSNQASTTPATASGVLAAARERAARSVLRKSRYKSVEKKYLANITQQPSSLSRSYYQQVHPDKFWSTMRNWDFLSDLNKAMKSKTTNQDQENELKKGTKRALDESSGANEVKESLPDTFESVTQYKALWSPLLIEEAKAQIMSDVVAAQSSRRTSWIQNTQLSMGAVVKAEVSVSARTASDYDEESAPMEPTVIIRLKRGSGIGCQVFSNDLLLFTPTSSTVEVALRGMAFNSANDSSVSHLTHLSKGRLGFVGRALNHRSGSVDGLLVRVTQKLWTQFSALTELFVIKIGSNITAIREFNALMRVDKLPLNSYLLDAKAAADKPDRQPKGQVLDELPVAFQTFLKSKANQSQLGAISAAAREYGDGGFTLIKGPPGKLVLSVRSLMIHYCAQTINNCFTRPGNYNYRNRQINYFGFYPKCSPSSSIPRVLHNNRACRHRRRYISRL